MTSNSLSSSQWVCSRRNIVRVQPHCCESVQWYVTVASSFAILCAIYRRWQRPSSNPGVSEDMERERGPYTFARYVVLLATSCVCESLLATATPFRWKVEETVAPLRLTARAWTTPSSHASGQCRSWVDIRTWQRCATCVEALGKHLLAQHDSLVRTSRAGVLRA